MEDLTDKQGGLDREIGIFLRPTTGSGLGRVPCGERLFGEPDRDIAPLAQRFVIFGPVGHFVTRFFNLVTAALIVFVRHWLFCRWNHRRSCQIYRPRAGRSIYSTTPNGMLRLSRTARQSKSRAFRNITR